MELMDTSSVKQIFQYKLLQTIFNKIYVVDLASNCCGEADAAACTIGNPQDYDDWLISLAEKMFKSEAADFFSRMNLKRVCESITENNPRYIVYYRLEINDSVQEYRLSICFPDESRTQLLLLQEDLKSDDASPIKTRHELYRYNERLKFLVNRVVEDFIEVNVETRQCRVFSESSIQTCSKYERQIQWWAENLIVPEERDAYIREYELSSLVLSLRTNNGYHSATYTAFSGTDRNSLLIISTLRKETYGKAQEYIFAYAQDVTQLKVQETRNKQLVDISQQLLTLSQTEPVTGLFNRAACERKIEEYLAVPKNGTPGTMLLIDIDHFKEFNDQYGHSTGDFILKYLAKAMQDIFRSDDILSRWGGDEFVVFMRDMSDWRIITSRIERLRARLWQCRREGNSLPITISIGVEIAVPAMTLDILFDHCDKALYKVKLKGRNSYMMYSE